MSVGYKILAALLLAAAAVAGYIVWHAHVMSEGDAAGYARAEAQYRQRENQALQQALADKARLEKELQGVSENARKQLAAARADADRAVAAGDSLRNDLAAARRRAAQLASATPGGSASADAAERVLDDVQRRLDEATNRIARFADESHAAGLACERSYDAVK